MASYADYILLDERLVLLQTLAEATGYKLPESVLQDALSFSGHKCGFDHMRKQLVYLHKEGLLKVDQVEDSYIATLTRQGKDVAEGNTTHAGVKRPAPKG